MAERFLASLELPNEIVRTSVVTMCGYVHRSIETTSERFYAELRRRVYTTPKSYLDLISLYMSMLTGLQDVVETKSQRMKVGVEKLIETNLLVDALRADLVKLEPVLKQKTVETEVRSFFHDALCTVATYLINSYCKVAFGTSCERLC